MEFVSAVQESVDDEEAVGRVIGSGGSGVRESLSRASVVACVCGGEPASTSVSAAGASS